MITSGFVNVELPIESDEADEENKSDTGRTVLYVFGRGYAHSFLLWSFYGFNQKIYSWRQTQTMASS